MKIGVFIESFRKPFDDALKTASSLGAQGFQMYATEYLKSSVSEKNELRNKIRDSGLEIAAFCGDMGHRMFYFPEEMQDVLDNQKRLCDLAYDFGVHVITSHIGVVPEDKNNKYYGVMYKVYKDLAEYAANAKVRFAIETGPEKSLRLKSFLDDIDSKGAGVNLDPANLAMVQKENPVQAVYNLKDYIVHTHAKDGRWIKPTDSEALYIPDVLGIPRQERGHYQETPLGEGDVPWSNYLKALKDIGYDGFLTIEREVGETPEKDIALAINSLKEHLKNI